MQPWQPERHSAWQKDRGQRQGDICGEVLTVMGALDRWLSPSANLTPATSATFARKVADVADVAGPSRQIPVSIWNAEDWNEFFDERAAIAEFDGGLSRPVAEQRALESCIAHWLNLNPADPTIENSCAVCGETLDHSSPNDVTVLRPGGGHHWLHEGCLGEWWRMRRQKAVKALAKMGLSDG